MKMNADFMLQENVWDTVLKLAVPAMLAQLSNLVYNIADTYFVSLTRDTDQIAAVSLSLPLFVIVMAIGTIFSLGGSSVMTRALGAKDENRAKNGSSYALFSMILCSIAVAVLGSIFLEPLTALAGAKAENVLYTKNYLRYIFLGTPMIMCGNGMVALMRSHGLVKEGTIGIVLGNAVNVVLDYALIIAAGLGTSGAAIATALGYGVCCLYYVLCIRREIRGGNRLLTLDPRDYHPTLRMTKDILVIGLPGGLVCILICVATMILNNYLAIYGAASVACYGIAIKLYNVPSLLSQGLSSGIAPLFGYCYGARAGRILRKALRNSLILGAAVGLGSFLLFLAAGKYMIMAFLSKPEMRTQALEFLLLLTSTAFSMSAVFVFSAYFQSIGKALPATLIVFLKNIILFIPAVILLNHFFGVYGVVAAQPIVEFIVMLVAAGMYIKERGMLRDGDQ